jgi:hypothetical protein
MSTYGVHVCSFTSLDALPARRHGDPHAVLRAILQAGRFSVFDAVASRKLAASLQYILDNGWVTSTNATFPWTYVTLMPEGERAAEPTATETGEYE